jgi:hypothetical protein
MRHSHIAATQKKRSSPATRFPEPPVCQHSLANAPISYTPITTLVRNTHISRLLTLPSSSNTLVVAKVESLGVAGRVGWGQAVLQRLSNGLRNRLDNVLTCHISHSLVR